MGKPLDFLQSALKALSGADEIVKWGTVLKCTGYGGWLVLDMLQWVRQEGAHRCRSLISHYYSVVSSKERESLNWARRA